MTPKQFYDTHWKKRAPSKRQKFLKVLEDAGTNLANFQQIACHGGSVSKAKAKQLAIASGNEMTILEILYPEDSGDSAA